MKKQTIALAILATLSSGAAMAKIPDVEKPGDKAPVPETPDLKPGESIGQDITEIKRTTDLHKVGITNNQNAIAGNATQIGDNTARIDGLENALKQQGEEMRERYDGVKASMHAITNARPVAYDVGSFAVGAGLGAAGSKQAVAVGGAYRFNESWSGSFTVAHETEGTHTKADTSAGVGAQFQF